MNRRQITCAAIVWIATALSSQAATLRCPPDSVKVGPTCIDTYEASVWKIDPANATLVRKVQTGRATLADLTAGGAILVSPPLCTNADFPANFPRNGEWAQIPGSNPSTPRVSAPAITGSL